MVHAGNDGYWLVSLPGIAPGDDVEAAISAMIAGAGQAVIDGLAELLAEQNPYSPAWHSFEGQTGFVVVAPVVDEANQRASSNVLALMVWMLGHGATLITPLPLTEREACEQFSDWRRA